METSKVNVDRDLEKRGLSRREIEVVAEVVTGKTNQKCADALFITEKTIKFHLTNIFSKMSLKNRQGLILEVHKMQKTAAEIVASNLTPS